MKFESSLSVLSQVMVALPDRNACSIADRMFVSEHHLESQLAMLGIVTALIAATRCGAAISSQTKATVGVPGLKKKNSKGIYLCGGL